MIMCTGCGTRFGILSNDHTKTLQEWIVSPLSASSAAAATATTRASQSCSSSVQSASSSVATLQSSSAESSTANIATTVTKMLSSLTLDIPATGVVDINDSVVAALVRAKELIELDPVGAVGAWVDMEDDTEAQAEMLVELIDDDANAHGGADIGDGDGDHCDEDPVVRADQRLKPFDVAIEQIRFHQTQLKAYLATNAQLDRNTQQRMFSACHSPLTVLLDILPTESVTPEFLRNVHNVSHAIRTSKMLKKAKRKQASVLPFIQQPRSVVEALAHAKAQETSTAKSASKSDGDSEAPPHKVIGLDTDEEPVH